MEERAGRPPREKLVGDNLHIVKIIAYRAGATLPPHVDLDDLISAGTVGLIESADRFDPGMGVKFSTFASARIRGAIMDELRAADWMTRGMRERKKRLDKAFLGAEKNTGRSGDARSAAEALGVSVEELHGMLSTVSAAADLSRQGPAPDTFDVEGIKGKDADDPDTAAGINEIMRALAAAVKGLPEKERVLIALYYYDEMTLMEVGSILDLTESRVSQLHAEIMKRLRAKLIGHGGPKAKGKGMAG